MATHNLDGFARTKYFYILDHEGAKLLTYILKLGTSAPTTLPGIKFNDYLNNPPAGVRINYVSLKNKERKKVFDPSQMNQINNHPMWDNFDVTLLYQAIRLGNKDIARLDDDDWNNKSKMEGLLKSIKELRNDCVHDKVAVTDQNFDIKFNDLKSIFVQTLNAVQRRYNVPDRDLIDVRNQILQNMDASKQAFTSMEAANYILNQTSAFIVESQKFLKNQYQQDISFDPLSFLKHSPQGSVPVQSIYCEAFLKDGAGKDTTCRTINCLDLLSLTCSAGQSSQSTTSSQSTQSRQPQLIMIDGYAGSGKTTLILFMLSEWLKDAHHCRIAHLDEFDILLRIVCRENNEPSLQQFLANTLPDVFSVFPQCLVPLLKKCTRVIILIDGLDELSSGGPSENLVHDILRVGKGMPNLNIICTSRPEAADNFMAKIPARYKKWELKMKGVSREHRANFVLKHYSALPGNSQTNPEAVRHYMDRYGWKDHFGLPLNLLFMATLFYVEPDCLKNSSTQTDLYISIHEWCVEKLLKRLANQSNTQMSMQVRSAGVRKVLHDLYCVALQGLLEDRLRLSDEDVQRLTECCNTRNLPVDEVLGAFFCLRENVVKCVSHRWYSAPHKSLQEFFAAKFIVNKLVQPSAIGSDLQHTRHTTRTRILITWMRRLRYLSQRAVSRRIRQILGNPTQEQLRNLRNLLLHVVGLLCQRGEPYLSGAVKGVVDLVAKSGVKHCNNWLSILNDAGTNEAVLQGIVQHIDDDQDEWIKITASDTDSAESLLPLIPSKPVQISLEKAVDINKLIKACEKHSCKSLELRYHFKHPNQHSTLDSVLAATNWNDLLVLTGHLTYEGITYLQRCPSLLTLRLALSDGSDIKNIPAALTRVQPLLPVLHKLNIHVPVMTLSTPWEVITPLPPVMHKNGTPSVTLVLSGVNDALMDTACKAAQTLQPKNGYERIALPGSNMSADSLRCLLNGLASRGVRVEGKGVAVPRGSPATGLEMKELDDMAKKMMLGGLDKDNDAVLWWL